MLFSAFLLYSYAGLTNPPSVPTLREVPYPLPNPGDALIKGAFEVAWDPPRFTGGRPALHYNITIKFRSYHEVLTSNTHSVVVYLYTNFRVTVTINVTVTSSHSEENTTLASFEQLSEPGQLKIDHILESECSGEGNAT